MAPFAPPGDNWDAVLGPFERETALDAFIKNPGLAWTPTGLCSWYGIRVDLVRAILEELVDEGIIRRVPGRPDSYALDQEPLSIPAVPPQPREFVCKGCQMLKHRSQLRGRERTLCRDCVDLRDLGVSNTVGILPKGRP
jgi:uncharacterized protein DUF4193